jgi:hypothetical protein
VIVEGNDTLGGHNKNTGLSNSDVFFFGNKIGDTFISSPSTIVSTAVADALSVRNNPGILQAITNPYDFDKNQTVSSGDELTARNNAGILTRNLTWTPPAGPLVAMSLAAEDVDLAESFDDLASAVASALAARRAEHSILIGSNYSADTGPERRVLAERHRSDPNELMLEAQTPSDKTHRVRHIPISTQVAGLNRIFERSLLD